MEGKNDNIDPGPVSDRVFYGCLLAVILTLVVALFLYLNLHGS